MKWKLMRRFLAAIVITIVLSLACFLGLNIALFYVGPVTTEEFSSTRAPQITLRFERYLEYRDGVVRVREEGLRELEAYGAWVQVLDENGTELYSHGKPEHAPSHYTPGDLVFYYKYSDSIKGYTIFVARADRGDRKLSYIVGFPWQMVAKASLLFQPSAVGSTVAKLLAGAVAFVVVIAVAVGYAFSARLVKPMVRIVDGIQSLAAGRYGNAYPADGLYRDVYASLNHLASTLQSNEAERKSMEKAREAWITNITHDLKTPLASIKGYAELLADPEYALSVEERTRYAEIILDKAAYMDNLTEDLKLTYQLKNELLPLKLKRENLVDLVRETVIGILNHPAYEERDIRFEAEEEELPFLCDGLLLQRAFANLIYNALVHNPKGTCIRVGIGKRERDRVVVEIEDNGKGIPAEELDLLFERYYRGTNTGDAHKGSGLGMAIAKQIVEAHGGTILVDSRVGAGTKVAVMLPMIRQSVEKAPNLHWSNT